MEDTKLNNGIAALLVIASFFAGWQTILLVAALLLVFGKVNESTKQVIIRVVAFLAGIALFMMIWDLLLNVYSLITGSLNNFAEFFNYYLKKPINLSKLFKYFLSPVGTVLRTIDSYVDFIVTIIKLLFVIAVVNNKPTNKNFLFKLVDGLVKKFSNFVNNYDKAPAAPAAPVQAAPAAPAATQTTDNQ